MGKMMKTGNVQQKKLGCLLFLGNYYIFATFFLSGYTYICREINGGDFFLPSPPGS
jgi:hypothetical protein